MCVIVEVARGLQSQMAVGQNQWYHSGVGAPPILVYFSGDWDVHWGYDLDFDPWPNVANVGFPFFREERQPGRGQRALLDGAPELGAEQEGHGSHDSTRGGPRACVFRAPRRGRFPKFRGVPQPNRYCLGPPARCPFSPIFLVGQFPLRE